MRPIVDVLVFLGLVGGVVVAFWLVPRASSQERPAGEPDAPIDLEGAPIVAVDPDPDVVESPLEGDATVDDGAPVPEGEPADDEIADGPVDESLLTWADLASYRYTYPTGWMEASAEERPLLPSPIPDEVRAHDGQRRTIAGHVLPLVSEDGWIYEFMLVRYFGACCFGMTPAITEWIYCYVQPEDGFDIIPGEAVLVTGELEVGEEWLDGGFVDSIYRMRATSFEVLEDYDPME